MLPPVKDERTHGAFLFTKLILNLFVDSLKCRLRANAQGIARLLQQYSKLSQKMLYVVGQFGLFCAGGHGVATSAENWLATAPKTLDLANALRRFSDYLLDRKVHVREHGC